MRPAGANICAFFYRDISQGQSVAKKSSSINFEKTLAELETLVEKMEKGDLSLEESLQCFERGIVLTRNCQQALSEAEQKVKLLLEQNGKAELTDFGDDESED